MVKSRTGPQHREALTGFDIAKVVIQVLKGVGNCNHATCGDLVGYCGDPTEEPNTARDAHDLE